MVDEAQLSKAVAALTAGKSVVFPTDTVYGIGIAVGLACSPEAIFIDKRRDPDKAIPWLVGSPAALTRYGRDVSQLAHDMVSQFWPGPLTLVVKAGDNVPEAFRGANDTIALRMPNDSVALELIERVGFPLATSSANFQRKETAPNAGRCRSRICGAGARCAWRRCSPLGRLVDHRRLHA